jgi:hypothetical protein
LAADDTSTIPENKNLLPPTSSRMILKRAPALSYFLTKVEIPGLSLPQAAGGHPTPFVKIPQVGDQLEYDELMVQFKVDEDLVNWLELYTWIKRTGHPDDFGQFRSITDESTITGGGLKSDIIIQVMTSKGRPNYEFTFKEAFPIKVTGYTLDNSVQDIDYITATGYFAYTSYDVTRVKAGMQQVIAGGGEGPSDFSDGGDYYKKRH